MCAGPTTRHSKIGERSEELGGCRHTCKSSPSLNTMRCSSSDGPNATKGVLAFPSRLSWGSPAVRCLRMVDITCGLRIDSRKSEMRTAIPIFKY